MTVTSDYRDAALKANKAISKILERGGLDIEEWWDELIEAQQTLGQVLHRGWKTWNGGEAPVSDGTQVRIRFRNGEECDEVVELFWNWTHTGHGYDIVEYRVHHD